MVQAKKNSSKVMIKLLDQVLIDSRGTEGKVYLSNTPGSSPHLKILMKIQL